MGVSGLGLRVGWGFGAGLLEARIGLGSQGVVLLWAQGSVRFAGRVCRMLPSEVLKDFSQLQGFPKP